MKEIELIEINLPESTFWDSAEIIRMNHIVENQIKLLEAIKLLAELVESKSKRIQTML